MTKIAQNPSAENSDLDFNDQFTKAHCLMEMTDASLFLTGKAGTGKSTLLTYFRKNTKKKVAFLAPTGVAAVHIKGQTIHSFFKFKPNVTLQSIRSQRLSKAKNIYKKLDTIVIDEVSMVRADLMDCIDKFLRLNGKDKDKPFGGIQMIFIGDLYQLPPVINSQDKLIFSTHYESPYFFSAHFFKDFEMELVELEKIYRQKDTGFIQILNAIRNNTVTQDQLGILNRRYDPNYVPPENPFFIYLTPTNKRAQHINQERLDALKDESSLFEAEISGTFGKESYPCPLELELKPGAQIMMNNNDSKGRWINGTMGKVVRIEESPDPELPTNVVVRLENGRHVYAPPNKWEIYKIFLEGDAIESETLGTFSQYPMNLAWAVTIHKSQGKTFDHVILDIGQGVFSAGQTYVALSRCTSLEGLVLKAPLQKRHVWTDTNIIKFITQFQYKKSEDALSLEDKKALIQEVIATQKNIKINYLKGNDTKSQRLLRPSYIKSFTHRGESFEGLEAYCFQHEVARIFRIDRILEIEKE